MEKIGARPQYRLHGHPTRSAWGFLGEGAGSGGPCDLSCKHCFYANKQDYIFNDAESLLCRFNKFRHYYGLNAVDLTGGEATIYVDPTLTRRGLKHRHPDGRNDHLAYLVQHCTNIGLAPSIITHGANNTEALTKQIEDAGLDTWEFSLHGLGYHNGVEYGRSHDSLVVGHDDRAVPDHFGRMVDNAAYAKRPIRWNCSVTGHTYEDLPGWARFITDRWPPTVGNMIAWMAYDSWGPGNVPEWMKNYTDYAPFIAEAVDILEEKGWEANVRYFPLCEARKWGFAANTHQHYQIQFDPWEWAFEATADTKLVHGYGDVERGLLTEQEFWAQAVNVRTRICDGYGRARHPICPPCQSCAARTICEGPDSLYIHQFGHECLDPIAAEDVGLPENGVLADPNHFLRTGDDVSLRKQVKDGQTISAKCV